METAVSDPIMESSSMETASDVDHQPTTIKGKCTSRRVIGAFGIFGLMAVAAMYHQLSPTQTSSTQMEQSNLASADINEVTMLASSRRRRRRRRRKSTTKADVDAGPACVQQCADKGYTCAACTDRGDHHESITSCASNYGLPSCAMGCHMGSYSEKESDCISQCDQHGSGCNWDFRGTMMNNCGAASVCTGQDRSKASKEECKVGCRQMFDLSNDNGPHMDSQEVLDKVNQIRADHGKKPMTYYSAGEACADKAAAYNAIHGAHKCEAGACNSKDCGWRAAGDFNANDKVDAVVRAYESRWHEGPKDGTCDEQSHCGALLIYDKIAVGCDENKAYYTIYYYNK